MSKVKIISDSTCDLSEELLAQFDVAVLPHPIVRDGELLQDNVTIAYDFGLILGDILVYCYREHVRYRSFLTREGTPVDTGLEVHGSTHDDGTADNHGEGTGELTAAALHTVLDGKAKVHKAEDDEDAAEGGHTIREKVFHVFQHG